MTQDSISTRRSFLKAGAVLAVPVAAGVPAATAMANGGLEARLARREDEAAIRELHETLLRRINGGVSDEATKLFANPKQASIDSTLRSVAAERDAEPDAIEIAGNGRRATGRFHCAVEIESEIAQDCTLAQMAHAQGEGFLRSIERRLLKADYVKTVDGWAIARLDFVPA